PLVDGQGNFGSVDGDSPAAMRYTEARLTKIAEDVLKDLDKDTVDMVSNFDESLKEPTVLPTRIPNLLVNGSQGIAVGMATNMAPHNLSEVIDGTIAYIDNNNITIPELMKYVQAPDFPTGGFIYGYNGVKDAFETGKGRIVMRARVEIEENNGHEQIVATEIPYMVNKAELVKKISELAANKVIEGINFVNDESDRTGWRIVVDVKKDANANIILNKLYQLTDFQASFIVNNIALVNGRPMTLNLKQLIQYFVDHRHDVITRRTQFELKKAEERAHILQGLIIAVDNIDEVIQIIRNSKTVEESRLRLIERFEFSQIQANAIVEMRLRQLTGLAIDDLKQEYKDIEAKITDYKDILARFERRMEVIKEELLEIKEKYGDKRRTEIVFSADEFNPEDFYANDNVVITISHFGYIKRMPLIEFKAQNRGGMGSRGSTSRDEDFIEHIYQAKMHNYMLFFTKNGKCYWLKVYDIPEGSKQSKGKAIQNLLLLENGDKVNAYIRIENLKDETFCNNHHLIFCTKKGIVKRTTLEAYSRPRNNGINAININDDDSLIQVCLTDGNNEVILVSRNGLAVRFYEDTIRSMGRTATGVRGMMLDDDPTNEVVSAITLPKNSDHTILIISEKGYGKRTLLDERDDDGNLIYDENGNISHIYRITNRGTKGVKTINITERTGKVVAAIDATDNDDLMIINRSGIVMRLHVSQIRPTGRTAQGVRLINLEKRNEQIASVCRIDAAAEEDVAENEIINPTEESTSNN
ncbi:MAG: DNA gyrase subunit A, partial [Bacteroidales bacterium]|nr:DNA gyrase subunit A [Bacteroidales bacterium]